QPTEVRTFFPTALRFFGMRRAICLPGSSRHSIFQPSLFYQSETSSTHVALAFSDSPDTLERTSISNGAVGCFVSVDALYEQRVHRMLSWSASWVSPANGGTYSFLRLHCHSLG
ncbi:hypothetical protein TGCAST_390610, partial [Toxoplasma gondii CAST]